MEGKKLLIAKDIATRWGCDIKYVYRLNKADLLRGMILGGKGKKYRPEEVMAFEIWAEGKDISDPEHVRDLRTGEEVPHRFAGQAEILVVGGNR